MPAILAAFRLLVGEALVAGRGESAQVSHAQAEWLREHAFRTRRPQAEIVREALAEYQARTEAAGITGGRDRNRALTERFAQGQGVDVDLPRDKDARMWTHDP